MRSQANIVTVSGIARVTPPHRPNRSRRHTATLQQLLDKHDGSTTDVSFRQLVGPLPADDLTHGIYPYPARLIRHIPNFLFGAAQITDPIEFAVDPFCGSGTILLEAQRHGIPAYGFEQNPVAALITRVKTTPRDPDALREALTTLLSAAKSCRRKYEQPQYLTKWYNQPANSALSRLSVAKADSNNPQASDFLDVVIALLARRIAVTDPAIPVPVRVEDSPNHRISTADVWAKYLKIGHTLIDRIARISSSWPSSNVYCGDSRDNYLWSQIPAKKEGVVFTSPPYGAAQKYVRSTSLEAGWLGFTPENGTINIERSSIGREHIRKFDELRTDPRNFSTSLKRDLRRIGSQSEQRQRIYEHYFADMHSVFNEISMCQNLNTIVLISGDNIVSRHNFPTSQHLSDMLATRGYDDVLKLTDSIRGRTLLTRRHRGSTPATLEYITIFRRKP